MESIKNFPENKDQLGFGEQLDEEVDKVEEVEEVRYFTCPSIVDYRETEAGDTELTFSDKKYMRVLTLTV